MINSRCKYGSISEVRLEDSGLFTKISNVLGALRNVVIVRRARLSYDARPSIWSGIAGVSRAISQRSDWQDMTRETPGHGRIVLGR
ncbi:unnamed protein product, partial [Nesidiocoris tenuis]